MPNLKRDRQALKLFDRAAPRSPGFPNAAMKALKNLRKRPRGNRGRILMARDLKARRSILRNK